MLDCFLYTAERQKLFSLVEHLIPKFSKLAKKEKFQILTRGINANDPEFYKTNITISLAVQCFLSKSKRFSDQTT